jgi:hypothetical protein
MSLQIATGGYKQVGRQAEILKQVTELTNRCLIGNRLASQFDTDKPMSTLPLMPAIASDRRSLTSWLIR